MHTLATREPRPNSWTPPQKALRAALSLQNTRLGVGWQTLEQLTPGRMHTQKQPEWIQAQSLTTPTLFLIDALSSALAFDVPEVMLELALVQLVMRIRTIVNQPHPLGCRDDA